MDIPTYPGIKKNVALAGRTTFGMSATAQYFYEADSTDALIAILQYAELYNIPYYVIAGGSNIIFSTPLFSGLIIAIKTHNIEIAGNRIVVDAGTKLATLVNTSIDAGLSGLESLSGIPGSVGGAICGNAGAYGQSIADRLVAVRAYVDGTVATFTKEECGFGYRHSRFKSEKNIIILAIEFELVVSESGVLSDKASGIIMTRDKKYPPDIKCPGSFFKNVLVANLTAEQLKKIPKDKQLHGKVPAGFLLEMVGAKGRCSGKICIAENHANTFINTGGATYADLEALSSDLKGKVLEEFGIVLEPEVQII